jgi:circadian clock protein KaiA
MGHVLVSPLHIHVLTRSDDVVKALEQRLSEGKFLMHANTHVADFMAWLQTYPDRLDCLIVDGAIDVAGVLQQLADRAVFVPTVILMPTAVSQGTKAQGTVVQKDGLDAMDDIYHGAVALLASNQIHRIEGAIQQAIQLFIALPAESCTLPASRSSDSLPVPDILSAQKERLTDKLKARLGYLGVYYKRNPDNFLRNMSRADRETYLKQLKAGYRKIVLGYFSKDPQLNSNIDDFVNQAFFADVSVSHIVEIHMELMDEFSKQLKLEGRSEEILLDYRLTLIDVIAHLCEMYRRSIPREP